MCFLMKNRKTEIFFFTTLLNLRAKSLIMKCQTYPLRLWKTSEMIIDYLLHCVKPSKHIELRTCWKKSNNLKRNYTYIVCRFSLSWFTHWFLKATIYTLPLSPSYTLRISRYIWQIFIENVTLINYYYSFENISLEDRIFDKSKLRFSQSDQLGHGMTNWSKFPISVVCSKWVCTDHLIKQ